jgi:hypothetical protein
VGVDSVYLCPSRIRTAPGYAYNRVMDQRLLHAIPTPARAPLAAESSLGRPNANDFLEHFAAPHHDRGNVLFVAGHVKAFTTAPSAAAGVRSD